MKVKNQHALEEGEFRLLPTYTIFIKNIWNGHGAHEDGQDTGVPNLFLLYYFPVKLTEHISDTNWPLSLGG
jgi:hypothetical protein